MLKNQALGTHHPHHSHLSPNPMAPALPGLLCRVSPGEVDTHMLQLQFMVSFYFCGVQRHIVSRLLPGARHPQPQPRCHPGLWE